MFFAKFCCKYFAFLTFLAKKAKNDYFEQRLECAAPRHWSKYTTLGYNSANQNPFLHTSVRMFKPLLPMFKCQLCIIHLLNNISNHFVWSNYLMLLECSVLGFILCFIWKGHFCRKLFFLRKRMGIKLNLKITPRANLRKKIKPKKWALISAENLLGWDS